MGGYSAFAEFYDKLTDNVEYNKRADYICSLFSKFGVSGGILLDLACGTGTLSCLMAKRGFDVIGVDSSPEMLSAATEKKYENALDILFLCQDMCTLDLYGTVDCAVCTLDSLNHLKNSTELNMTFAGVSLFMNNGGIFIFDVNTEYKHREILADNTFVYEAEDVYCVWQNTFIEKKKRTDIHLDMFSLCEDGSYERSEESFSEQIFSEKQLSEALTKHGFTILEKYDELTLNAPDHKTQRIFYVCRKDN